VRELSLSFTFDLTLDGKELRVVNRPGDAVRMRAQLGGGDALDKELAAGGVASYEVLFSFAWQATRHHPDYPMITFDEFLDRCEGWKVVDDEGAVARPTEPGPSSAP
jgi:uncharacterized short protein YbdD (DUF466 family)